MGRLRNETTPQAVSTSDAAEHEPAILQREINQCAKHLMVPRGFKQQCVDHDLPTRFKTQKDLLLVSRIRL